MPTHGEVDNKIITDSEAQGDENSVPGANTPEGELAAHGQAKAASEEGIATLQSTETTDGLGAGDLFHPDPASLSDAAKATGTGAQGAAAGAAVEAALGRTGGGTQVKYRNQGATRNERLTPALENDFKEVGNELYNGRYDIEVFSGGQHPSKRFGTTTNHDFGGAADFLIRDKVTGELVNYNTGEGQAIWYNFSREMSRRGWRGQGAGPGYMEYYGAGTAMHIGVTNQRSGAPVVWGSGGSGRNAPNWLRRAVFEGAEDSPYGSRTTLKGYAGGQYTGNIVAVDEAAKAYGSGATVAGSVGFGGAQRNPAIASAASQTFQSKLGHKPVNWLAQNGPGMAGWQAFLQSGPSIVNGYLSPFQHLQAWTSTWFRPYPNIGMQLWKGGFGFNTLTNPQDLLSQIINGSNYTHILSSYLGGLGMGGSGGSGGPGGPYKTSDVGKEYNPYEGTEGDDGLPLFIREDQNNAEGTLIRSSVVAAMPYAVGLRNGLDMTVDEYLRSRTNYPSLVGGLVHTGLLDPNIRFS